MTLGATRHPFYSLQMRLTPAEFRAVLALAVGMFCVQVDFFALIGRRIRQSSEAASPAS